MARSPHWLETTFVDASTTYGSIFHVPLQMVHTCSGAGTGAAAGNGARTFLKKKCWNELYIYLKKTQQIMNQNSYVKLANYQTSSKYVFFNNYFLILSRHSLFYNQMQQKCNLSF